MKRLLLLLLTALTATFPPYSLFLSLLTPNSCPSTHALPHPNVISTIFSVTTLSLQPQHVISMGEGLSALAGSGVNTPLLSPDNEDVINPGWVGDGKSLDTFRVSFLGTNKGVDSTCIYSMVELKNNHPTEDIVIYSAHIEPSIIFPLKTVASIAPNPVETPSSPLFSGNFQSLHQQELRIHPGSTVTVPVSILPHYKRYRGSKVKSSYPKEYPSDPTDEVNKTLFATKAAINAMTLEHGKEPSPTTSNEKLWLEMTHESTLNFIDNQQHIQLDLQHMIQSTQHGLKHPPIQSILDIFDEREIHETLLANTSWGFLRMKVPYTCSVDSMEFTYGLPNNLIFLDGGGGWYARRNATRPTRENGNTMEMVSRDPFIYHLSIDNPSYEKSIQVWDIFTTKPDVVAVQYRKSLLQSRISNWDDHVLIPLGGRAIPPRSTLVYIASIELLTDQLNRTHLSKISDLGFLEVRTNVGDFSIGLDLIPNRQRWGPIYGIQSNHSTVGNLELSKSFKLSKLRNSLLSPVENKNTMIKWYSKSDIIQSPAKDFMHQMEKQGRISSLDGTKFMKGEPFLVTEPSYINFGVITTSSRSIHVPINLANRSPFSLLLMRISVSVHMQTDDGVFPVEDDHHNLEVGLDFAGVQIMPLNRNGSMNEFPHDVVFAPGMIYEYPINVWCKFTILPGHVVTPRSYHGSIVIRSKIFDKNATENLSIEWTQDTLLADPLSQKSVTTIPFHVTVLPGNFRISTNSLLFPSHYSMFPLEEFSSIKWHKKNTPNYVDRLLNVTNNFAVPVTIKNLEISNSHEYGHCNSIFSIPNLSWDTNWQEVERNSSWKVPIRFTFHAHLKSIRLPKKCILTLETDRVGKQSLPLIIHSGKLIAEVQSEENDVRNDVCGTPSNGTFSQGKGVACLQNWVKTNAEGQVFRDALKAIEERMKSSSCLDNANAKSPEEVYFSSLMLDEDPNEMEPVLIKVGAVSAGSAVHRSIFLTNVNPVPIRVAASSTLFEHVNVDIGHKYLSISDALEQMPEVSSTAHMKYFLTHSATAQSFFPKLKNKIDISLSPLARISELSSLYENQSVEQTFQDMTEYQFANGHKVIDENITCSAGLVISTDGLYHKHFTSRRAISKNWTIPPGGVARFVMTLRTPDRRDLESDISSFIATGLMLETDHSQAFPIILTYSVVIGQLHLLPAKSHELHNDVPNDKTSDRAPSLQIPMTIRDNTIQPVSSQSKGSPILIENTFSKDILLGEIKSCNQWFDFTRLSKRSNTAQAGSSFLSNYLRVKAKDRAGIESSTRIPVGEVHFTASCSDETGYGSFFSCALKWLQHRDQIQPRGCGLTDEEIFNTYSTAKRFESENSMKQLKKNAIDSLIDAVDYFARQHDGNIMPNDIYIIQKAREAWELISSHGLNVVTGHLTAMSAYHDGDVDGTEYNPENDVSDTQTAKTLGGILNRHSDLLSVPVSSILLKGTLDPPQLFVGKKKSSFAVVEFDPVQVAQTSVMYIPVSNPSGVDVRVRLVSKFSERDDGLIETKKVFMQTSTTDGNPWWTGERYWMSSKDGHVIGAPHNVTFTSGSGSIVNLVQPSLQSISTFLLGCGVRCGRKSDTDNDGDNVFYSVIGAGSGSNSTLIGHPWHVTTERPLTPEKFNIDDPEPFSVGYSGVHEIVLPPYGKAEIGPIFFRPTKRGEFNTSLLISNNLTGFEEIELRGRGTWEKLAFLDNDIDGTGGDVELRHGRSTLVFSRSAQAGNKPVVKSFVLANLGDVTVKIGSVSMKTSEIQYFSYRSTTPPKTSWSNWLWSLFHPLASDNGSIKCSSGRFNLVGCEDSTMSPKGWARVFSPWYLTTEHTIEADGPTYESNITTNSAHFHNGFTLGPNENMTFYVEHRPDCVLLASYASIVFEINGVRTDEDQRLKTFRNDKLELLVGYSMNSYASCIPYVPPTSKLLEKAFSFAISSHIMNILALGLVKRNDEQGNQYIQYENQISYITGLFILLFMLLAIDIYTSVGLTRGIDQQSLSWKQTCRCLARADPVSTDLVALGKEQTKHVLLSRFRKENVIPTHCVLSDGSFTRNKLGSEFGASSTTSKRMSSTHQQATTLSDAVFHRRNLLVNESKITYPNKTSGDGGILPCGIAWRTAVRRGISVTGSVSALPGEPQHLKRTQNALLKTKLLQPKQKIQTKIIIPQVPPAELSVPKRNGLHNKLVGAEQVRPPQDQELNSDSRITVIERKDTNEHSRDQSKTESKLQSIVTRQNDGNIAIQSIPVITKQSVQKFKQSDCSDDKQNLPMSKQMKHDQQNRSENNLSSEQTANYAKTTFIKRNTEEKVVKLKSNGKDKNGLSQSISSKNVQLSVPIVIQQPGKSQKLKEVSKRKDTTASRSNTIQNGRKSKQNVPQIKISATSEANTDASLPKQPPSKEPIPNYMRVSTTQPSLHSDNIVTTPKPMSTKGATRPPPGLLPPPGFSEPLLSIERASPTHQSGESTPTLLSPERSTSDLSPTKTPTIQSDIQSSNSHECHIHHESTPSPSLVSLLSTQLDGDGSPTKDITNNSTLITDLLPPPPRLSPPLLDRQQSDVTETFDETQVLLGTSSSFNVINFLDGIMNDSTRQTPPEEPVQSENVVPVANLVSRDPWSSRTEESPRNNPLAAIIGRISDIEATTLRGQDEQMEIAGIPLTSNIPSLLTSSSRQNSGTEPTYTSFATEVQNDDENDFLEPDSFYSQLLGE